MDGSFWLRILWGVGGIIVGASVYVSQRKRESIYPRGLGITLFIASAAMLIMTLFGWWR